MLSSHGRSTRTSQALSRTSVLVVVAALCFGTAGAAREKSSEAATQPRQRDAISAPASGSVAPSATGLKVFIDPSTGRITSEPTAAQRNALRTLESLAAAGRAAPRIENFTLPDGTRGAFLDGAFLSATHVHRQQDGSFVFGCRDPHPSSTEPAAPARPVSPPRGVVEQ